MPAPGLGTVQTVFLDRDGTINVKRPEGQYVTAPEDLVLLPGAAQAIASLNAAGIPAVLVTNQSWLSRSPDNAARYAAVHARLEQLLAAQGARLDAAYHCPHARDTCDCRKPLPGLLRRAAAAHRIDLSRAVMIGDRDSDLMAGRAAGTSAILVRPGTAGRAVADADVVTDDLAGAVRLILQARSVPVTA
ncbi:MAG TPA: HAD family hydrolase [Streptosporangiaceae bacterium]|jgi:D-glycero-D-manno-heptose 1,7-bisphosphate phosphatase